MNKCHPFCWWMCQKKRKRKYIVLYSFSDDHWLEIKMIYQTFTFTTLFSLFDAKRLARLRDLCRFCSDWDLLCFYIRSYQRIPQFWQLTWKSKRKIMNSFEHFAHCGKSQHFVRRNWFPQKTCQITTLNFDAKITHKIAKLVCQFLYFEHKNDFCHSMFCKVANQSMKRESRIWATAKNIP